MLRSEEFYNILKKLYQLSQSEISNVKSFEEVIESNTSRLEFLNGLIDNSNYDNLSDECNEYLIQNLDFIKSFMNGEYSKCFYIPDEIFKDMDKSYKIPDEKSAMSLLEIIKIIYNIYEKNYKGKRYILELPKNTFNQNMKRILHIEEHQIAHLLGLTARKGKSNNLMNYFLNHSKNPEKYGKNKSTQLLNWLMSEEGMLEYKKIWYITKNFSITDIKKYPDDYKSGRDLNINERFKKYTKEKIGEELEYPIINYSRVMCKCINTYSFLNGYNLNEIILDYEPISMNVTDIKDIFLVDKNSKELYTEVSNYINGKVTEKQLKSDIHMIGIDTYFKRFENEPKRLRETEEKIPLDKEDIRLTHTDTSIIVKTSELVDEYYKRGRAFFLDHIISEDGGIALRIATVEDEKEYLKANGYEVEYEKLENLHALFEEKISELGTSKTR